MTKLTEQDSAALQGLLELGRALIPNLEALRRTGSRSINQAGGLTFEDINLADVNSCPLPPGEARHDRGCFGIYFSPRGSAQGALLRLNVGGEIRDFGPGDYVKGPIEWFAVGRHQNSCTVGNARLVLTTSPWAEFGSTTSAPSPAAAVDLLGALKDTLALSTFQAEVLSTDPTGVAPAGSFDCSGWKKIRVVIDTQAGSTTITSFDLVPWWAPSATATLWSEQGTERVSVPDTDTTAGRFRVVVLNVSGRGQLYLAVRNAVGTGLGSVGIAVQGIE